MTVAFVSQSSILKHRDNKDFFLFLKMNYDFIVDGHDSSLYKRPAEDSPALITQYLDFLGRVSQHGCLGIYPPVSYQHTFRDKLNSILGKDMLPHLIRRVPFNVDDRQGNYLSFEYLTWQLLATDTYQK